MGELKPGQVIWIKVRFNNAGATSTTKHPYLIISHNEEMGYYEVAQFDSLAGKEYKALRASNKVIYCDNPNETVISKDSFVQMDNKFMIEDYPELVNYRTTEDTLSKSKFDDLVASYNKYQGSHQIDDDKIVYMDKDEVEALNTYS